MRDPAPDSTTALKLSRRGALSAGVAAGLAPLGCRQTTKDSGDMIPAGTAPERGPEPEPWEPGGTEDLDRFPFGVQVGDAQPTSAVVHLRTHLGPVTMVLVEAEGNEWVELERREGLEVSALAVAAEPQGMAVVVSLADLRPDSAYSVVFFDGELRSTVARFRTALDAGGTRRVVFGASSCFGGNAPWPSLFYAADEQLDFFCLLGDLVYADGSETPAQYRSVWDAALSTEGLIRLSASTSLVVTWDDHEVDNNWDIDRLGDEVFAVAKACFDEALPRTVGSGGAGIWRVLRWGATLDVFVLECRAERVPAEARYISDAQLQWLIDGVQSSTARFKIILNSVPITDLNAIYSSLGAEDRWDGFPLTRAAVVEAVARVEGVLFVSGDVHYAQVGYVDPAGGEAEGLYEVFTGPAGSFANVAADLFVGDPQYLWLSSAWNWCRFECDPVAGSIRVTHVGDDGAVLHDITLAV